MDNTTQHPSTRPELVTPAEALVMLRFSRDLSAAEKTARNMLCRNAAKPFPLPIVVVLGKKLVRYADVLALIDSASTGYGATAQYAVPDQKSQFDLGSNGQTRPVGRPRIR